MGRRIHDFTGQRFGKLIVTGIAGRNKKQQVTFHCKCDCGNTRIIVGGDLGKKKNHPKSCGCYRSKWREIDPNRQEKRCSRCKEVKPIGNFSPLKASKDGHGCYCGPCERAYQKSKPRPSKEKVNAYNRKRNKANIDVRIGKYFRSRIHRALRGKKPERSKITLAGCSMPELRKHLERQFRPGMTWENYGKNGWHIDHIRPCASFDLTDPEQQKTCFHYTNLQPLWADENQRKSDSLPKEGLSILGGSGFIGGRYAELHPDAFVEPRNTDAPTRKDALYFISTTSNYNVFTDLKLDINTNLSKLVYVLPHVGGVFNYISSWFVYGQSGVGLTPVTAAKEGDPCDPNGFYSITKYTAENYVRSYAEMVACGLTEGPSGYRVLRLSNVIGNDPNADSHKNALEWMLRKVVNNEDVTVYTGDNWRNFLHVDDACRAINLILTKGEMNTIYNVGNTRSVRIFDLIEYAIAHTGSKSRIHLAPPPRFHQIVQTPDFWMDTTKLRSLGFVPDMDAYQAVERVLANLT